MSFRVVAASRAKNNFGEMIKRVYQDEETQVIERGGLPVAAIVSISALIGIQSLVTRETLAAGVVGPDERVSRSEALAMYTAHHFREEEENLFSHARASGIDLDALGRRIAQRRAELEVEDYPECGASG